MTFKPNTSGNPNGRPKGTGSRQKLFSTLVEPHKEALFDTALKIALEGNETMLRLFLERMLPPKPSSSFVSIPISGLDLTRTESVVALGKMILESTANSELTLEEAKGCMSAIDNQSKLIVTNELAQRVGAIERTLKLRK